jgi:heterodisulfide reductase subunit B
LDWAYKTECCGAGLSVSRTDVVAKLSGKILEDATDRGAETIVVACPMCHSNLDLRRKAIKSYLKKDNNVPVIFITQAIGIALGIDSKKLGIDRHMIDGSMLMNPKPVEIAEKAPKKQLQNVQEEE